MAVVLSVGAVAALVAKDLLTTEAGGWLRALTRHLTRRAARRLPSEFRARYEEEWLAEMQAMNDRPVGALVCSLRLTVRARSLCGELAQTTDRSAQKDPKLAPAFTELGEPRASIGRHDRPLLLWSEVFSGTSLRDLEVDEDALAAAGEYFADRLGPAPIPTSTLISEFRRNSPPRPPRPAVPALTPYLAPVLPKRGRPRRRGSNASVDPDWRLAPLTRAERSKARHILEGEFADGTLDERAVEQIAAALDRARSRGWRRCPAADDHAIRLAAFWSAWSDKPDEDASPGCTA